MAESVNTNIANAILRHLTYLNRLENGSIRNIKKELKTSLDNIEEILKSNSDFIETGSDQVNALTDNQRRKLENLSDEIRRVLLGTSVRIDSELTDQLTDFVNAESEMITNIVNRQIPPSLNVGLQFNRLSLAQVDAIVNTPLGGATYNERLANSIGS